jgi:hypothetical protein
MKAPRQQSSFSELAGAITAYHDFRLLLGRIVGIAAIVYGIFTFSLYFFGLGLGVTILFWVLDRINLGAPQNTSESTIDSEVD